MNRRKLVRHTRLAELITSRWKGLPTAGDVLNKAMWDYVRSTPCVVSGENFIRVHEKFPYTV